jgi:hypothetical protein
MTGHCPRCDQTHPGRIRSFIAEALHSAENEVEQPDAGT